MFWYVTREAGISCRTYGPFSTPARASGWGFSRFGAATTYNRWSVHVAHSPTSHGTEVR